MAREVDVGAWRLGRVAPLGGYTRLGRLLDLVQEGGLPLDAEPGGLLVGGEYDGGCLVAAPASGGRRYFMVQAEALPLLRGYMNPADYGAMVARTPKLRRLRCGARGQCVPWRQGR